MAATDQTYRNQRILDVVFAASCVLLLLSTLWMFAQDYNREFKDVQRTFRDVEAARTERLMLEALPEPGLVRKRHEAVVEARQALARARESVAPEERRLTALRDQQDNAYREIKADYDSKMSFYNI